jgi:hypothetical protein
MTTKAHGSVFYDTDFSGNNLPLIFTTSVSDFLQTGHTFESGLTEESPTWIVPSFPEANI